MPPFSGAYGKHAGIACKHNALFLQIALFLFNPVLSYSGKVNINLLLLPHGHPGFACPVMLRVGTIQRPTVIPQHCNTGAYHAQLFVQMVQLVCTTSQHRWEMQSGSTAALHLGFMGLLSGYINTARLGHVLQRACMQGFCSGAAWHGKQANRQLTAQTMTRK
jgi:hypothetical protein